MLNRQEIFDKIVAHARAQQCKCEGWAGNSQALSCLYRGPNNTKCFIGALMSDEAWSPEINIQGVTSFEVADAMRKSGYDYNPGDYSVKTDAYFLSRMQGTHDFWAVENWENQFKFRATEFKLEYKAP